MTLATVNLQTQEHCSCIASSQAFSANYRRVALFWIPYFAATGGTVKPVLNGISSDLNIFPLKPGFRLIRVHYIQYKKLNQDMKTLN
jgi:hypothetical protein